MLKRLKIAYEKVYSFLFGLENEHIHTKEDRKQYFGRIKTDNEAEARMIHQYPREGKFRFPLIADEKTVSKSNKDRPITRKQPNEVPKRVVSPQKTVKKPAVVPTTTPISKNPPVKNEDRKKFQGVNFKARNIPSPIYAFDKPPVTNLKQVLKDETEDSIVKNGETNYVKLTESENSITNLNETVSFTASKNRNDDYHLNEKKQFLWNNVTAEIRSEDKLTTSTSQVEEADKENDIISESTTESFLELEPSLELEQASNLLELSNTLENSDDRVEQVNENNPIKLTPLHEEPAAALEQQNHFSETEKSLNLTKKNEQCEQVPVSVNTNNTEGKKLDCTENSRKTIVPFNVLMLHKDRLAQKKNEAKPQGKEYQFPTLQLLNIPPKQPDNSNQWLEKKREILELTLANFNVQAKVIGVTKGPSVTRFEIQPEPGVKVSKITGLTDDIKLSLAAKDIRIEAPIPGKNAIGIEVPNDVSEPVVIREILRSGMFQNNPSPLTVAMGLDIEGKPIVTDIQKMPHGLIAGATGSGKSVCINSILISIMFKASPDEVKLMLVDPKMVELAPYNDIPHLVTPVITDAKQATIALKWAVEEMERRYELFVQTGVRDIKRFNDVMKKDDDTKPAMPYIVIVIDELADLMMVSPQDVEEAICRIAQKARACGIHLLLATQRPSVDVITGLIKANIPTRVAFSVSSQADSRTIIDSGGAERLLGKGDMLLFENGASKPVRVQGNFVSDEEIDRVIALVKAQRKPNYLFDKEHLVKTYDTASDQEDDLFEEACYYVLEQGGASSSSLQRRFRIGFNRAARLIDMMEARGIISEAMGSKPRNVLISEEELSDRM